MAGRGYLRGDGPAMGLLIGVPIVLAISMLIYFVRPLFYFAIFALALFAVLKLLVIADRVAKRRRHFRGLSE